MINTAFLSHACEILAETNTGISGSKIVRYLSAYAVDYAVDIPYASYPFPPSTSNKRTALLKNLQAFSPDQQVKILIELCQLQEFIGNEAVSNLYSKLISSYGSLFKKMDQNAIDNDLIEQPKKKRTDILTTSINVYSVKEIVVQNAQLPRSERNEVKTVNITSHLFDVALSYPGEMRNYVEDVARELEKVIGPNSYFYDNNYKAQLARPSLDTLLQDIYRNRSKLVVVFLCEKYQEKEWCNIEFRAIREIIMERDNDNVMFVKMDDGRVHGVFKTDGYIDGRTHTPHEVAAYIQERISIFTGVRLLKKLTLFIA
ncbi:MAG: TIR domain-containing protein [Candidatus Falkowbacteria bacterium]